MFCLQNNYLQFNLIFPISKIICIFNVISQYMASMFCCFWYITIWHNTVANEATEVMRIFSNFNAI